jgi:hypothetical protein
MSTKQIDLVCINNGANVGTYSPHKFLASFTGDINEICLRCLCWDDDRQVETNLYNTYKIVIPEWMSESFYLNNSVEFHYSMALLGKWGYTLNEVQLTKVFQLNQTYKYFLGWLFKGNTKNSFKLSMRENCMMWLNGESKYKLPLSTNQFEIAAKYCPLYEANKIANHLYYAREYWLTKNYI